MHMSRKDGVESMAAGLSVDVTVALSRVAF